MAFQDYFTHFEPSQLLGWAKTGVPWEKLSDHPQAELGLSHVTWARLEPTTINSVLKISILNHSAMGATQKEDYASL